MGDDDHLQGKVGFAVDEEPHAAARWMTPAAGSTVRSACGAGRASSIGETLGALEVAEAARTVRNPTIARACARIAEDELHHAALGWRTARWLLGCHPELFMMASDAFRDGIARYCSDGSTLPDAFVDYGIAMRRALRRAAAAEVIAPLAEQLMRGAV